MKLLNLSLLCFIFLLSSCKKELSIVEGDPLLTPTIAPGFLTEGGDSAWIYRIVGSRHRLLFSGSCPTPLYRWYESLDNDSFYIAGITRDKIFANDHYYYGTVLCGGDTLRTDTITPCSGLTAYFDYIPDLDGCPSLKYLRPRSGLLNGCTVDSVEWFKGNTAMPHLNFSSIVSLKNKDSYSIIFHCSQWGCSSPPLTFTYLESPAFTLKRKSDHILLKAPSSLNREDVQWYVRPPGYGWGLAQGGSYSTFKAIYPTVGYRYYARVTYLGKVYFTNMICL